MASTNNQLLRYLDSLHASSWCSVRLASGSDRTRNDSPRCFCRIYRRICRSYENVHKSEEIRNLCCHRSVSPRRSQCSLAPADISTGLPLSSLFSSAPTTTSSEAPTVPEVYKHTSHAPTIRVTISRGKYLPTKRHFPQVSSPSNWSDGKLSFCKVRCSIFWPYQHTFLSASPNLPPALQPLLRSLPLSTLF